MREVKDWDELDLKALITNSVQEGLTLDYKECPALENRDGSKAEISKDVSAFANSAGGIIVYGMIEDNHYPKQIDAGYDPNVISKEWLEQVINSRVRPRIDGLLIKQIAVTSSSTGRVVYAVSVPQSKTAHQASDKRYYKRFNFEFVPMEDYEIRDTMRRSMTPELFLTLGLAGGPFAEVEFPEGSELSSPVELSISIANRSEEPSFYSVVRVFIDERLTVKSSGEFSRSGVAALSPGGKAVVYQMNWSIPGKMPIFKGIGFHLSTFSFEIQAAAAGHVEYFMRYEVHAPGCSVSKDGMLIYEDGKLHLSDGL